MIIAQLSDTHIKAKGVMSPLNTDTATALKEAMEHLNSLPARPDVVLITGDCVDTGTIAEYEHFQELLTALKMPVYLIPGNHDNRENMLKVFGRQGNNILEGFIQYVVDDGPVRLIALDTNIPGENRGQLCDERLNWLDKRLDEASTKPTIIFLHHPPFNTGFQVLDEIGLEHADKLGEIVAKHKNIERVIAGHVHCEIQRRFHGTIAETCPSTAYQTYEDLRETNRLSMVLDAPTCLLHAWNENTGLVTHTSIIKVKRDVKEVYDGERWCSS